LKDDELELMSNMTTEKEVKQRQKDMGWEDKDIKKAL
jgi:hypothetical protein